MVELVVKHDGSVEEFQASKLNHWAEYACKQGGDWSKIALNTFKKLPKVSKSSDIHQTMIDVCYADKTIESSRIAARLEVAQLRKNMERHLGVLVNSDSWEVVLNSLFDKGVWCKDTIPPYSEEQELLYQEVKKVKLEAWQVAQWSDKYLLKIGGDSVETPQVAAMGIGLGLLGDNKDGGSLVRNIVNSKVNLPTPILNGVRDGSFDGVSCCVISADDTIESVDTAEHIAARMTAKKAGIGIEYTTRSLGADVRKGMFKHLGKHSIYASLDTTVKKWQQVTRGGSATVSFNVIDPEVEQIALWKSQRIDIEQRLDKLDYTFCFNDAFLEAVVNRKDWYLFDYSVAPNVWDAFYTHSVEDYNSVVAGELAKHTPHKKVNALDLLKHLLIIRNETGRLYCLNVSRCNKHTPFIDVIKLSNLCLEVMLPTKPYKNMLDLYNDDTVVRVIGEGGEVIEFSENDIVKTNNGEKFAKDLVVGDVVE